MQGLVGTPLLIIAVAQASAETFRAFSLLPSFCIESKVPAVFVGTVVLW